MFSEISVSLFTGGRCGYVLSRSCLGGGEGISTFCPGSVLGGREVRGWIPNQVTCHTPGTLTLPVSLLPWLGVV